MQPKSAKKPEKKVKKASNRISPCFLLHFCVLAPAIDRARKSHLNDNGYPARSTAEEGLQNQSANILNINLEIDTCPGFLEEWLGRTRGPCPIKWP